MIDIVAATGEISIKAEGGAMLWLGVGNGGDATFGAGKLGSIVECPALGGGGDVDERTFPGGRARGNDGKRQEEGDRSGGMEIVECHRKILV